MSPHTTIVAQFSIPYYQYLDLAGQVTQPLPAFAKENSEVIAMYRMMVLTRLFDKKAVALQRTGKLGTYPPNIGQEAIGTGLASAMQKEDILCPYYRENAALFWRGVKMEEILLYWGGDERGSNFKDNAKDFPICVPIASQTLHAAGAAYALKYRGINQAVVAVIGDGGTSRGDFYESINLAGVWELPLVYVINSNQWAISVPTSKQTKAQTLAQKAIAAGIEGWQIDGNDIFAVRDAVSNALNKARSGNGPTVIEALSYRMGDHTTADDASRYRSEIEVKKYITQDPIIRLRNYMLASKIWDETQEINLLQALHAEVDAAVEHFEKIPPLTAEAMFDYLYESLPTQYLAQRNKAIKGESA